MQDVFSELLGLGLEPHELNAAHMSARAVVVYTVVLAIVRLGKRRFMGGASAFDVILAILLGAVASRAVTGSAPFLPTLVATAVLMAMHWVFSWGAMQWSAFGWLTKGQSVKIIHEGHIIESALRSQHISHNDLDESLREHGIADAARVHEARLERSGKISVCKKT